MSGFSVMSKEPSIIWAGIKEINDRIDAKYFHYDYMTFNLNDYDKVKNLDQCVDFFETGVSNFNEGELRLKRLKTSNIQNNVVLYEDLIDCKIQKKDKRKILQKGDVVLTTYGTGSIGKTAYINSDTQIVPDYTIAILRTKSNLDSGYLMSFFSSSYGNQQVLRRVIGTSGITLVIKPHLKDIKIPIPSPEIQKYIGDKVRRAEELREEAKAAKKDYEYIIQDIYYDSNIIKFPKGFYTVQSHDFDDKHLRIDSNFYNPLYKNGRLNSYKNVKLSKLVDLKKNCKIQAEEEYAYFEIGDLSTSNILDGKERVKGSELPGRAKLKLEKDDIIVSLVQESIEVTSYVDKELNNTLTTNGCAVLIPRDKSLSGYLYAIISSKYFIAQKCRYISGTNIRSMSKDDLLDMKIPIVEDEIITKVNGLVLKEFTCLRESKQLILEAIQDVEDLIEGDFEMSELNNNSSTESRC
ncbi:restriction endonuclease subunit S [Tepidanaerobacter sp. EBM-49]|uniref:restriction endonuclease subunit S n=1 Tax=Tepidanaerobacter sp. EBM-49 TaxID=1918504 RepID=UPI000B075928|nr:restriction endonuclease subunit S [Tepidanaerobacter sp. EBM-49]